MQRGLALAVVIIVAGLTRTAHADPPENMVLTDLGLHVVGIGYQHSLSGHLAVQLDAESYTPWTQEDTFFEVQGVVVRVRPIFYKDAAPTGWWLSPFGQVGVGSADRGSGLLWALGGSIGYAWLVLGHLHIAIGAGAQYDVAKIAGGSSRPAFAEVWPTLDGSLGYAF